MCIFYRVPDRKVLAFFGEPDGEWSMDMAPLLRGPIVRKRPGSERSAQIVIAQWGMVPPGSTTNVPRGKDGKRLNTVNARRETLDKLYTYRGPWRRGQRCIIPAEFFVEPYWGKGHHIAWALARADGGPWGLAGLWSEWTSPDTGEILVNFTMVTQNCDDHPLLKYFHRPDLKRPPHMQDKRTPVPIQQGDWDTWLFGSLGEAEALIKLLPASEYRHGPRDPGVNVSIDIEEQKPAEPDLF